MFGLFKKKRLRVSLPKNQRIIAIGDIHGQYDRLMNVMEKVEKYRKKNPAEKEQIIFLGDYADRGPHSKPVIDYLCDRQKMAKDMPHSEIFLIGNHEELLLETINGDGRRFEVWWRNGGRQAIHSYLKKSRLTAEEMDTQPLARDAFCKHFPKKHKKFYSKLSNLHKVDPFVFVHAGINMGVPLKDQNEEDMRWIRTPFLKWRGKQKDFLVVHGHTITPNFQPEIQSHRIGIDTGSYRQKGCITAAIFEKDTVRFLKSDPSSPLGESPFS